MTVFMTDILQNYAQQQPEMIATMYGENKVTYGEFYKRASKFAAYLQEQGYEKMMLLHCIRSILIYF